MLAFLVVLAHVKSSSRNEKLNKIVSKSIPMPNNSTHTTLNGDVENPGLFEMLVTITITGLYLDILSTYSLSEGNNLFYAIIEHGNQNILYYNCTYSFDFNQNYYTNIHYINPNYNYTFFTYFPFQEVNNACIVQDTSNMQFSYENQMMIYFMHAGTSETSTYSSINLLIEPKMSFLELNVHFGTNFPSVKIGSGWTFFLSGLVHNGTFNVVSGVATIDSESKPLNNWNITDAGKVSIRDRRITFDLILFPQTLKDELKFTAVHGGYVHNEVINISVLESGNVYSHNVIFPETFTFTQSNTLTNSNTFTQSNTLTNSNTFTQSNTFTASNTFNKSKTFAMLFTNDTQTLNTQSQHSSLISYVLISFLSITQTMSIINSLSYAFTVSVYKSSFISSIIEYVYYQYTIIHYTSEYILYSQFYVLRNLNLNQDNINNNSINIIIIVVCAIVGVALISLLVVLLIRYRNHKQNKDYNETESIQEDKNEVVNDLEAVVQVSHIAEDPFANDFNEDNIIAHI